MRNHWYFFIILAILSHFSSFSAAITPKAGFIEKQIRIGEHVHFWMSIQHPKNVQVIFPDSLYKFEPFEYVNKQYFQTQTNDSISLDSAVYTLTTFEIDALQTLKLPIYVLYGKDSIATFSTMDTLVFQQVLQTMPNPIQLKQDTSLQKVDYQFNYYYIIIGLFLVGIAGIVLLFLMRKSIFLRYHEYLLKKKHQKFLLNFDKYSSSQEVNDIQKALLIWKNYLGELEKQAFDSFTSKELYEHFEHLALYEELQKLDYYMYADATNPIQMKTLKSFAEHIFDTKKQELIAKYGR